MNEAREAQIRWFWRSPLRGLPAIVHPGLGQRRWWLEDRAAWSDGERLFIEVGEQIACVEIGGLKHGIADAGGLMVWSDRAWIWAEAEAVDRMDPRRERRGAQTVLKRPRGSRSWEADGLTLPMGAARAEDLTPFSRGWGVLWTSEGYLYRMRRGGPVQALATAGRWLAGPRGAAVTMDSQGARRVAAPDGPMWSLPSPMMEPWFSADGGTLCGVHPEGGGVEVDLASQRLRILDGRPVGGGGWLDDAGRLTVDGRVVRTGLREASFAQNGERLAGPGGYVWDLRTGARIGSDAVGPVQLGATVATEEGFATVDWETGRGSRLDREGERLGSFEIPLPDEDVVIGGLNEAGEARFETALGRGWRLGSEGIERCDPPNVQASPRPRGWDLGALDAEAVVAGRRWAYNVDGLLVARGRARPTDP